MQQLSAQDSMFSFMETPNTPMHLGWLNIYDPATAPGGKLNFDAIVNHVAQRLHTVRFFRQKLAFVPLNLAEPYWVDDEKFDLDHHVHHVALPGTGGWRQLCTLVARLFARPLNFARPLWEFHVIEGLDNVEGFPAGSFALLVKIHHTAVDGISGVDVTTSLHTSKPDTPDPSPPTWDPEPAPPGGELLRRAVNQVVRHPGRRIRILARNSSTFRKVKSAMDTGELRTPTRHKTPATLFSGQVGPHRVVEARRYALDDLKPLRELVPGASLNDVLLAVVGGAMREYLLDKRALPDTTLTASCPISLRSEEERGTFGNKVGNMNVGLATDTADPVERLRQIHEETANAKGLTSAIGARTLTEMSQLVPGALMGLAMRASHRGGAMTNTTVTNIPGPQQPLYLAGARLYTQFTLGTLLQGMGIFHAVQSYCGQLALTVVGDRGKLPDPAFYGECIQNSFESLTNAARAQRLKKAGNRARRKSASPRHKRD